MFRLDRLSLRLRIGLFFALIATVGVALVLVGAGWVASEVAPARAADVWGVAAGIAVALALLTAWVALLFDENIARPITQLSGELGAVATSPAAARSALAEEARYLGGLGPAAAALSGALGQAHRETDAAIAGAVGESEGEKAHLEAVLRDLRECLVICNLSEEILLYNREAQRLLGAEGSIGLGRRLNSLVTPEPVRHAIERLKVRLSSGRWRSHADHLSLPVTLASRSEARILQGRVALIMPDPPAEDASGAPDGPANTDGAPSHVTGKLPGEAPGELPGQGAIHGFVLTLRDATTAMAGQAARDGILAEMIEGLKRPSANLCAAAEILDADRAMALDARSGFLDVLAEEGRRLSERLVHLTGAYNELRTGGWSMNDVSTEGLGACLRDRLGPGSGIEIREGGGQTWLHCDSFGVVELMASLVTHLHDSDGVDCFTLSATRSGSHEMLDLTWVGPVLAEGRLEAWLAEPLAGAPGAVTCRDVLRHHRTEPWSEAAGEGMARLRLPLPPAVDNHGPVRATALPPRPEFYDFALLGRQNHRKIADVPLSTLHAVVFDTETTGLFPSAGDEIVQVAGLRVVNGRVIRGESFDRLVDPGRHIPAASTQIHGITDAMVAGQGKAGEVLRDFHDFLGNDVLVAHNAPFDMAFLRLKQAAVGRAFDGPVLDTVLLSAHLFGQGADHTLDSLSARFDIGFKAGTRHTALADAEATAAVFCAMLPPLAAAGIVTLGDALAVSDEAAAIRRKQARY
ncbi:MAG: 3'-5' exonuclease [Pseudomonadota bacterium]